jgi:hypothetical protein
MSNGRVRRTESEWREVLSRFKKSGLSAREFCRREEIQVSSFLRWRQRLRGSAKRSDFVSVVATSPSPSPQLTWSAEVTLPDGTKLRFQG